MLRNSSGVYFYDYVNQLKKQEIDFEFISTFKWYTIIYYLNRPGYKVLIKEVFPRFELGSLAKSKIN